MVVEMIILIRYACRQNNGIIWEFFPTSAKLCKMVQKFCQNVQSCEKYDWLIDWLWTEWSFGLTPFRLTPIGLTLFGLPPIIINHYNQPALKSWSTPDYFGPPPIILDHPHWVQLGVSPIGGSPNGGSPNGSSPNDPIVQLGAVQMGVVQLGVVQMGVVQMGVVQLTPQSDWE